MKTFSIGMVMSRISVLLVGLLLIGWPTRPGAGQVPQNEEAGVAFQAVLLSVAQTTPERLREVKSQGRQAVVLQITGEDQEHAAAQRVRSAGLDLYYWIEIARNRKLAEAHPDWMASLQGHTQWRRLFPDLGQPEEDEVVKVYPWVPILYREAFQAHLWRVRQLLQKKPLAKGIFLNDLQGAPSACGCGNPQCRWTTDYGPIKTATPSGADAATRFVAEVQKLAPHSTIIPVWVTECEERDGAPDGLCAGVGCFQGICWRAYTRQLMPLAETVDKLAVLVPFREFHRDVTYYGKTGGWIEHALKSFQTMPPRHGGQAIAADRLLAVLQGWEVNDAEIAAQQQRAQAAGAAGFVVSYVKIDQSWTPRLVKYQP